MNKGPRAGLPVARSDGDPAEHNTVIGAGFDCGAAFVQSVSIEFHFCKAYRVQEIRYFMGSLKQKVSMNDFTAAAFGYAPGDFHSQIVAGDIVSRFGEGEVKDSLWSGFVSKMAEA